MSGIHGPITLWNPCKLHGLSIGCQCQHHHCHCHYRHHCHHHHHHLNISSYATIFAEMGGARKLQQILTKALAISNLPLPKQNELMKIKEILKMFLVN
jgi:hypothetical protein